MQKRNMQIGGLLLGIAVWLTLCSVFYSRNCCGFFGAPFSLMDGATGKTVASSSENITFGLGNATLGVPGDMKNALKQTADYLKSNPSKLLFISGLQLKSESADDGLSATRAKSIKNYLVSQLGASANQIFTKNEVKDGGIGFTRDLTADAHDLYLRTLEFLSAKDGDAFSTNALGNFVFPKSSYNYTPPSDAVLASMQEMANYLKANPKRSLNLKGIYKAKETNSSAYPDIGIARATAVKNLLTELGAPSKQLFVSSTLDKEVFFLNNKLTGGVRYMFDAAPDVTERVETARQNLDDGINLYFETNVSSIELTAEQRQFFSDLGFYLDQNPKAKVSVNGYTDNKGKPAYNKRLSRHRARTIQAYLIENGIPQQRIIPSGKGDKNPKSTNSTEEGRAENRRVEVRLK